MIKKRRSLVDKLVALKKLLSYCVIRMIRAKGHSKFYCRGMWSRKIDQLYISVLVQKHYEGHEGRTRICALISYRYFYDRNWSMVLLKVAQFNFRFVAYQVLWGQWWIQVKLPLYLEKKIEKPCFSLNFWKGE